MTPLRRPPVRVWVWTAAALALVVVAALLWRGSDAAATVSTTARPADAPTGAPAGAVSARWTVGGEPLPEAVVQSGRVLIGSAHGVRALDPDTGEEVWRYSRSNARLCGLTATDGVAVALFRTAERCDEAVALQAGTGVRAWTRNVNFRADATLDATDRIVLARSPTGVVTLDPVGDSIRWRYQPPEDCRLIAAEVGSSGVAVLQRCTGSSAVQLRLLDGFDGSPVWSHDVAAPGGTEVRLLGADRPIVVLAGEQVQLLSGTDGALLRTLPGAPADDAAAPAQVAIGGTALLWAAGTVTALDGDSGAPLWAAPAVGLPGPSGTDPAGALLVPVTDGFVTLDRSTGAERGRSSAPDVAVGGAVTAVGPVIVHRLTDRVVGYR